jgi:hypothetical protein
MPSFLKRLLGGAPAKKPAKKAPSAKTYVTKGGPERAAVIAEAMDIYRRQRPVARGLLDQALREMRDKPAAALRGREGLARALALHRAHVDLKRLFGHNLKQFLVLAGIREWLEEGKKAAPAPRAAVKR